MPIRPPVLDDRTFEELVQELINRVPAHTPEWTNPRIGDPGRTLVELFAWLGDTVLYRANLIPERQRLAFLRLLGEQMRPAEPAATVISLSMDDDSAVQEVTIRAGATVKGPVNFETLTEVTVLPISAETYYKRSLTEDEATELADVVAGLESIYQLDAAAQPYTTTPVFVGGTQEKEGFDVVQDSVDGCLWFALLAADATLVEDIRAALGQNSQGGQQVLSVGLAPAVDVPALSEEIGAQARIPHLWEVTGEVKGGQPDYQTLRVVEDDTAGLTQRGVQRLALPGAQFLQAPSNDVADALDAGVGDRPPRLDNPDVAERLVTWLRLRPARELESMKLSWAGINAVAIDQRQTLTGRVIGQSNGTGNQAFSLPGTSVEAETLQLQVETAGRGYQSWQAIDDLQLAGRDDPVFSLDGEAGVVRFGDGLRGRIPGRGSRIRVATMRSGGGSVGNLPPGSLSAISAQKVSGGPATNLKVAQNLPTEGGLDAETLAAAEQRIPATFRHRERAVTGTDYQQLAAETPGLRVGRVEVLPRFRPHQRRSGVPGVISVMVLPQKERIDPPAPRPDRPFLESVHNYLDERRPLGTELYVIGCEYVPLGISIAVSIRDGFGQETVLNDIRQAVKEHLWPLAPYGPFGQGWPLGGSIRDRELEVAVARVDGVLSVAGVNLFTRQDDDWRQVQATPGTAAEITLDAWQLPELLSVVVVADDAAPTDLKAVPNPFAQRAGVAVPVVPEKCA